MELSFLNWVKAFNLVLGKGLYFRNGRGDAKSCAHQCYSRVAALYNTVIWIPATVWYYHNMTSDVDSDVGHVFHCFQC